MKLGADAACPRRGRLTSMAEVIATTDHTGVWSVLEEIGVVQPEVVNRKHRLSLDPDALSVAADLIRHQRVHSERRPDEADAPRDRE